MTLLTETNNETPDSLSLDMSPGLLQISEHLYRWSDTCHVYLIKDGSEAVLVDFGDGSILKEKASAELHQVTDILMTHHHRDQGQGLAAGVEAGARLWVPHAEQDLFANVEAHWQARELYNNYNVRQDLYSLLESVPIAGTLQDYGQYRMGKYEFDVLPTPGHTTGSISILAEIDGKRVAFTGDLIAAPGKVWSLAATQWTYNGAEGVAATIFSLLDLKSRAPDILLPSHGDPILDPLAAIDPLVETLWLLLQHRQERTNLLELLEKPFLPITPHLLLNRTSKANSYVLLSDSGKALVIDYGYDFTAGEAAGSDRSSRWPWLYSIPYLKRDYGVNRIDVTIPTHYHDDHIAGFNLLRNVEGTQVWAAENFADILESPSKYDLPCLWYDPIQVDRVLPLGCPVRWEEYDLWVYPLAGHTQYAVAITFEVDGKRVLVPGDQYQGDDGLKWNYVYRNRFHWDDYKASAAFYRRFEPDLVLPGHWGPFWVHPDYLEAIESRGLTLEQLHQDLLPGESQDEVFLSVRPFQAEVRAGETLELEVELQIDRPGSEMAFLKAYVPQGWQCENDPIFVNLDPAGTRNVKFRVTPPPGMSARRARVAIDLTVDNRRYGQQAVSLVTVV